METTEIETVALKEFLSRVRAQGMSREHVAFRCPTCGTIQSATSLIRAGAGDDFDVVQKYLGFSCVGRWTGAGSPSEERGKGRGCNWTLGGLFQLHDFTVTTEDGQTHPHFAPVSAEEARSLMERHGTLAPTEEVDDG